MDPIAEMLNAIKNAYQNRSEETAFTFSKLKYALLRIMVEEGYLAKVKRKENKLIAQLNYYDKYPAINHIARISKPGRRLYFKAKMLKKSLPRVGLVIISTPQGLMSAKKAAIKGMGGEALVHIS